MKVVGYLKTCSGNKRKRIENFIEGVKKVGMDEAFTTELSNPIDCDVAYSFTYYVSPSIHPLRFKLKEYQIANGKTIVFGDNSLFRSYNSNKYHRYSINSCFPNEGNYCNNVVDSSRWEKIKKDLNIELKEWDIKNGNHILLSLQRIGGWSMCGKNITDWLRETVSEIRKVTCMPILIRDHPGNRSRNSTFLREFSKKNKNVRIAGNEETILDNLKDCWANVVFNSSPSVTSVIEGVPTYITDPIPERSQSFGVAHVGLENLLKPQKFDRLEWIEKISQFHWSHEEVSSGKCWEWMRECIIK